MRFVSPSNSFKLTLALNLELKLKLYNGLLYKIVLAMQRFHINAAVKVSDLTDLAVQTAHIRGLVM